MMRLDLITTAVASKGDVEPKKLRASKAMADTPTACSSAKLKRRTHCITDIAGLASVRKIALFIPPNMKTALIPKPLPTLTGYWTISGRSGQVLAGVLGEDIPKDNQSEARTKCRTASVRSALGPYTLRFALEYNESTGEIHRGLTSNRPAQATNSVGMLHFFRFDKR